MIHMTGLSPTFTSWR